MTQRSPRLHDPGYLAWLRTRPCCICQKPPPSDPCHIRYGSIPHNKPHTGYGEKPSDKWSVPMCRDHHRRQHSMNEQAFWDEWQYDPLQMAILFYAEYGGKGGVAKRTQKIKPRKPRGKRAKIRSRGFR